MGDQRSSREIVAEATGRGRTWREPSIPISKFVFHRRIFDVEHSPRSNETRTLYGAIKQDNHPVQDKYQALFSILLCCCTLSGEGILVDLKHRLVFLLQLFFLIQCQYKIL